MPSQRLRPPVQGLVIYRFDEFVIDLDLEELSEAGRNVPIEPLPLRLLVYLIEHRGRIVSKDELVDVIWGGIAVSDSAVTTAVKAVRRALRDDGRSQRYIRTLRGRGLRFVACLHPGESLASTLIDAGLADPLESPRCPQVSGRHGR